MSTPKTAVELAMERTAAIAGPHSSNPEESAPDPASMTALDASSPSSKPSFTLVWLLLAVLAFLYFAWSGTETTNGVNTFHEQQRTNNEILDITRRHQGR